MHVCFHVNFYITNTLLTAGHCPFAYGAIETVFQLETRYNTRPLVSPRGIEAGFILERSLVFGLLPHIAFGNWNFFSLATWVLFSSWTWNGLFFCQVCDLESVAVLFVLGDVPFFLASNAKSFYHCCFIGKNDIQKHDWQKSERSRVGPLQRHTRTARSFFILIPSSKSSSKRYFEWSNAFLGYQEFTTV